MAAGNTFSVENLTLGEISALESLSGLSVSELGNNSAPRGKMLAAMSYVHKRRNGFPLFTFNEALGLTITEANELLGLDDDEATEPEPALAEAADADAEGNAPSHEGEPTT